MNHQSHEMAPESDSTSPRNEDIVVNAECHHATETWEGSRMDEKPLVDELVNE